MKIIVGMICWNNINDIKISIPIIHKEIKNLDCKFFIVDNKSTDGSRDFIAQESKNTIFLNENIGISRSKNILIDIALSENSDYFFMIDGDVAPIKESFKSMIDFMELNKNVGVFGQNINFFERDINSKNIPEIFPLFENLSLTYNLKSGDGAIRSWTHYAIYRVDLFREGIRFDENGPFGKAGYGFDDDDLGMQINKKGYDIVCFNDVYCYHNCNSSVKKLSDSGELNYKERKDFFCNKWNM